MATSIEVDRAGPTSQFRTGTRAFQSVAVLKAGLWGEHAPLQDHLDDLESCLYVLAWICMTYDGTEDLRNLDYLYKWEHYDVEIAAGAKRLFLDDFPTSHITPYFSTPVFRKLFTGLAEFCDERYRQKLRAVRTLQAEAEERPIWQENGNADTGKKNDESTPTETERPMTRLQQIHQESKEGQDHNKFLAIIAKAIDQQIALDEIRKEEERMIPDPIKETNVEFVNPADSKTLEAGTPTDSPELPNSDRSAKSAYPACLRVSATSIISGTKRSHAESDCEGELETGFATKKMKQTTTFSSVPAVMSKRRSTRSTNQSQKCDANDL